MRGTDEHCSSMSMEDPCVQGDPEGFAGLDLCTVLGVLTLICLVDTPLVVTLSTHVTLCTVGTAFCLWCLTIEAKILQDDQRYEL